MRPSNKLVEKTKLCEYRQILQTKIGVSFSAKALKFIHI